MKLSEISRTAVARPDSMDGLESVLSLGQVAGLLDVQRARLDTLLNTPVAFPGAAKRVSAVSDAVARLEAELARRGVEIDT